jgi:hypothetical protein
MQVTQEELVEPASSSTEFHVYTPPVNAYLGNANL